MPPVDASSSVCPVCGAALTEAGAAGVCPRCALESALAGGAYGSTMSGAGPEVAGGFELIAKLGQGALATVWLARERKLDRMVALKLIPKDLDSRLTRRLVREGHALAALRHPNIVAVHSLETVGDLTYLAMDFVEGGDLKARLERHRSLSPKEAVLLVRKLAGALAHAHANGILHRDVKPSNILLDAGGDPRLADFELASPLERAGDLTQAGRVAGTAAYLAPELLAGANRASVRSDVYGLGAVLYECLTGRAPFIGDSTAAILAQLADVDPPPPRMLTPGLPRDLETICLKCLEKAPERRYSSAGDLESDLARWERGEPIAARPVGAMGKSFRWCRRNSLAAICIGIASAVILVLAIGGPAVAIRLERARARAAMETATSNAVTDFLENDLLAQASPNNQSDRDLKLSALLDMAAAKIGGRFTSQPLVEASIRLTLAKTYDSLGKYSVAQAQLERALQIRQQLLGPEDARTLSVMSDLVSNLRSQAKLPEGEAMALGTLAIMRRVLGTENLDTLRVMNHLAVIYSWEGRFPEAQALAARTLEIRTRVLGPEHPDTLISMNNLAIVYADWGKPAEAEKLDQRAVELKTRILGPENPSTLNSMHNLAVAYTYEGRFADAGALAAKIIEIRKRVLGPEHPLTISTMISLGLAYESMGRFSDAAALFDHVVEEDIRLLGPDHLNTLLVTTDQATVYREEGRLAEAEAIEDRVLKSYERVYKKDLPSAEWSRYNLALVYRDQGRLPEAEALARKTLDVRRRILGPNRPDTLQASDLLGSLLLQTGDFAGAESLLRQSLNVRTETDPSDWRTSADQSLLGAALSGLKRFAEAEPLLVAGYTGLKERELKIPAADRPDAVQAGPRLVRLYDDWGFPAKAEEWRRKLTASGKGT
jgi:tetratricopeptide (TPR) repeat protein/tRNA A-37 threonylcarbamoyl transferase component Bud32